MVGTSVGASVVASLGASVGTSVGASVGASAGASVGASVFAPVGADVGNGVVGIFVVGARVVGTSVGASVGGKVGEPGVGVAEETGVHSLQVFRHCFFHQEFPQTQLCLHCFALFLSAHPVDTFAAAIASISSTTSSVVPVSG